MKMLLVWCYSYFQTWQVGRRSFFFQAEDGIRDATVTGVQTCALPISSDRVFYFTSSGAWKLPLNPPFLRNHGNYVVSLNKLAKWLAQRVEGAGVNIFAG